MKVIVLSEFRDLNDFSAVHKVGDIIEVADDRAAKLFELGLAQTEKKVEAREPKKVEAKETDFVLTTEETKKSKRKE